MRHRFKLALALFALSMGLLSACAVTALDGAETSLVYVGRACPIFCVNGSDFN